MDTVFSRLRLLFMGGLLAAAGGCATEEPFLTGTADGGLQAGFWPPSGGAAGALPVGTGGGDPGGGGTPASGTGGAGLTPGGGGSPGGYGGVAATGGVYGASGGSSGGGAGGACPLGLFFCPASGGGGGLGGAGGTSTGGAGGQGGAAGGADMCANETCFDIFDCFLYFPNATTCGFTKCEGLLCKK